MSASSDFDPGNMTTPPQAGQGCKRWGEDDAEDVAVTRIDFAKRRAPKLKKSTYPDSFPEDKNTFLKPLELENFKTHTKTGMWGFLLNVAIKYQGPLVVELTNLCRISK